MAERTYDIETVWRALDACGFDPGYQEVMVGEAVSRGEHWSWLDAPRRNRNVDHVHLTSPDGDAYIVRTANRRDCPHGEAPPRASRTAR
jgi:hypothetical protein